MAKVLHLSRNTVAKHMRLLEEHGLIITEWTQMKNGIRKNGNLRCTIVPMHEVLEQCYQRQMTELERQRVQKKLWAESTETICPPVGAAVWSLSERGSIPAPESGIKPLLGGFLGSAEDERRSREKISKPGRELRFSEYKNMPPAEPGAKGLG